MTTLKMKCRTCPIVQPAMREISQLNFKLEWARNRTNMQARKLTRLQKLIKMQRAIIDEQEKRLALQPAQKPVPSTPPSPAL